ncbi:coiled-coil domain-containing protein 30 isoform X6 [Falco biarmicus]|uniref:coiled-coil domain-containing protein 30 isoform X6 n=1 Tax=Falco cherrug TaxID=345164 RepID=UPI0018865ABA|nr:coiled-coil domain-containing protein 30 isoform X6 [Falco cherrug]XP_037236240.1 coiled-coil domain-containing protein 30 isoform X5 [Falco rusticolus]XP_056188093.1 coiled-coil domain-containing protein 30 isoform X6 [Falco biarmicus]
MEPSAAPRGDGGCPGPPGRRSPLLWLPPQAEGPVPAEAVRCWLRAEGADPAAPAEEQLGLAWRLLWRAEARLGELERRRAQEMRDVESYVGHVRHLSEERDAITTEYEKENEHLRLELTRLQLQQEAQLKEIEEMLEQEGLSEIAHSNASEQIAYLLVERTTLLEKLEITDQKLNSHSYADRLHVAQLQDDFDHTQQTEDELQQHHESMQLTGEAMHKFYREELEREQAAHARVERDLDEATQRLMTAQEEIQRLTDELDAQRKEQSKTESASSSALQAPESQEEWRKSDRTELQKAMEHNSRLDKEILALRARVQTLDLERKAFLDLIEQLKEEICEYQKSEKQGLPLPAPTEAEEVAASSLQTQGTKDEAGVEGDCASGKAGSDQEDRRQSSETLHRRCREVIENIEGRNSQLLHKLQKLEQEHEDLVERNEELESILGETQIQTKQEKEQFETEVEGLHRKITSLETELLEVQKNKTEMNGEEQALSGAQEMQEMLESCQETIEKLGSQLGERRERRKQLASELELLRQDLKAEKKVLGSPSLSEERFQQQEEKMQQLRQDLRRVQNLCSSAERELRYEREKNVDLHKQNLLLQQECTKVKAELKQAQAKLSDTTETCSSLSAQWEKSQQKVKELEQELLKCSQADKLQSGLQEKLAQEKSKVREAQKKISKLQQKLKDSQHQLLLAEARVSDKKLLEEELKETRENEARVQQELHEEQLKRKLLEQQVEELRQQLRHSQETEASLAKMHVELQAKTLHVLEDERKTDSNEHLQCQKENQKLSEQLSLLKGENKALYEEGVRLLNQKDVYVRKYNEMQLRHKDKIRRAKETFIHEVKQRDSRIKQLESELSEAKLQVEKGKVLIAQLTAENEKLLQERRRLLQKITEQEETPWSNRSMIATLQSRVKILDEENVRLRENKLQLSGHVPTSHRPPRSIHAPTTEDSKNVNFSESQLQSKVLPSPRTSFPSQEPPDSLSILKATPDTKPEGEAESQDSPFCLSPSQPSEIGYLNVASPGDTTASQLQEESQSISSENF